VAAQLAASQEGLSSMSENHTKFRFYLVPYVQILYMLQFFFLALVKFFFEIFFLRVNRMCAISGNLFFIILTVKNDAHVLCHEIWCKDKHNRKPATKHKENRIMAGLAEPDHHQF
jgi:hypothetical protein